LTASVASWFQSPRRYVLDAAAEEVVRICKSTPWWACDEGHRYIYAWAEAKLLSGALGDDWRHEAAREALMHSLRSGNMARGLAAFTAMSEAEDFSNQSLLEVIAPEAELHGNQAATVLFDCWRPLVLVLGRDTNLSGMLVFSLLGGELLDESAKVVDQAEVVQLIANARRAINEPLVIPSWANDGIHASGPGPRDDRFAGTLDRFVAMCEAYATYGRLDPADTWRPQYFSISGR
jgi:hypothetical protein